MTVDKKHIGLFFGSFNPIHIGHLAILNYAAEFCDFDEVWMVVSPQNPLKDETTLASENDRIAMVKLALEPLNLPVKICDIEFRLAKPSYTIRTLEALDAEYTDCKFSIIMGADSLADIELWREYSKILDSYKVYVYPRLGCDAKSLCAKYNAVFIDAPIMEISSTFVRKNIAKAKNMNAFISPEISEYIKKNNLYKN